MTPENINSWWLDNQLHELQRGFLGEGTTPNQADVSDRVNKLLQLNVGDVVWRAHRPVIPKVSGFCVVNALVWLQSLLRWGTLSFHSISLPYQDTFNC
jgi:hypothetical protein